MKSLTSQSDPGLTSSQPSDEKPKQEGHPLRVRTLHSMKRKQMQEHLRFKVKGKGRNLPVEGRGVSLSIVYCAYHSCWKVSIKKLHSPLLCSVAEH